MRRAKNSIRKQLEVTYGAEERSDRRLSAILAPAMLAEAGEMFQPAEIIAPLQQAGISHTMGSAAASGAAGAGLINLIRVLLPASVGGRLALAAVSVATIATAALVVPQAGLSIVSPILRPQSAEADDASVEIPQIALPEDLVSSGLEIEEPAAAALSALPIDKAAVPPATSNDSNNTAPNAVSKPSNSSSASSAPGASSSEKPAPPSSGGGSSSSSPTVPVTPPPPPPPSEPEQPPAAETLSASITFYGLNGGVTNRNPAKAVASAQGGSGSVTYSWVCWDLDAGGYMTGSGSSFDILPKGISPDTTLEISFRLDLTAVDSLGNTATAQGFYSIGKP
ncbi:hypothetical protein LJC64_02795 [Ruminococcaceae bacterium OttesenSCG-928-A11]|nr:hypothetical protein [Ruminococcaceae bacterium OttesenSCG-928-A11]